MSHRFRLFVRRQIEPAQHIGKSRIAAPPIDQDLFSGEHGHMQGLVDRQSRTGEDVGAVVLAGHRLLAFLLVKLEKQRLATASKKPFSELRLYWSRLMTILVGSSAKSSRNNADSSEIAAASSWTARRRISAVRLGVIGHRSG
jgi:hypothetical protein